MPDSELWLFRIKISKEGQSFTDPLNITKRSGYDNQPSFSLDGKKIYYSSVREDRQADIYCYEIKSGKTVQVTKTPLSEYSPVETPDGKFISSVVVEADSAQCIHFINKVTGMHEKKFDYDSVGYYNFLNNDTCIYYKLTAPHSLRYHSPREDKWLASSVVRAFKTVNRHTLVYGLKDSLKVTFYQYDFRLRKALKYCEFPSNGEDFTWHGTFGLVKSEGSKLLRFAEQKNEWVLLTDLAGFGIKRITRFNFDVNNKYLVIVDNL